MKKNDIITIEITAIVNSGHGLGRHEGIVVFVPFSVVGDVIEARILKVRSAYAYGRVEKIITPSKSRIESDCPVFGKCGGCDFRHINYDAELNAKSEFIKDAFTRIGGLTPEFLPVIPNENINRYRNKAQFPVGRDKEGKIIYGFYRVNSHDIIACENCAIEPEVFSEIAGFVADFAGKRKIPPYNEAEHNGVLRHIFLRRGHYSGEINLTLVARRKMPEFNMLAAEVRNKFPDIKGVVLNINREKTNVILGNEEHILSGDDKIADSMNGLSVKISPRSFYQINTPAAEKIYRTAKELIEPGGKTILDLYCGGGIIGLSMADEAREIIGIEIEESSVNDAVSNAERGVITNVSFINAGAEEGVGQLLKQGKKIDAVILDPSRKGCGSGTVKLVSALTPDRIVMISCNPVTAAADCKSFGEHGYVTVKVQGADLFSRTKHVECIVLLEKQILSDC